MKRVLFVCVHNAGRSQMAEALFNHLAEGKAVAISAGTEPAKGIHPEVAQAMKEIGLNLKGKQPKLLMDELVAQADWVITMGCAVDSESCPAIFLKGVEDWALEDPKGKSVEEVRRIRDQIRERVFALLRELDETR